MTKSEFAQLVAEEIEEAVMRAQGIGDGFMCDDTPQERAKHIASLLSDYAFSSEPAVTK
jgi:hypothetical protein